MVPNLPLALRRPAAARPKVATAAAPSSVAFAPLVRTRVWELPSHLLCSIVGTCLSTGELRKLVAKVTATDVRGLSDVALHTEGVALAGERGSGGKAIHKALDERHAGWLKRLDRRADLAALNAGWDEALVSGDIPGAYWALLSHPATDAALTKRAFGDVHMLSHLVGASNRVDLRKLRALEDERARLTDRLQRQDARIRELVAERDAARGQWQAIVVERAAGGGVAAGLGDPERAALRDLVARQQRRLDAQDRRRDQRSQQMTALQAALDGAERSVVAGVARERELAGEIAALEALLRSGDDAGAAATLDGLRILYVGGHATTVAALRHLVAARGGGVETHDGGVDERIALLAGLVGRADVVVFPVDCVSHEAMLETKRLCRRTGRPFVPLRSAGLSSVVAALTGLAAARAAVRAASG